MLLYILSRNPGINKGVTWASLFNTPMVTNKREQDEFITYLKANRNNVLLGAEKDILDPFKRLYFQPNRDYVLAHKPLKQLNDTRSAWEKYVDEGKAAHSLILWQQLSLNWHSPDNVFSASLKDQVTESPADPDCNRTNVGRHVLCDSFVYGYGRFLLGPRRRRRPHCRERLYWLDPFI